MMLTRLLLLLCLIGHVFAKQPPDIDCLVLHLEYVQCFWNKMGTPMVNYTFYSKFKPDLNFTECATYLLENSINVGCNQPYHNERRFLTFHTKLVHGDINYDKNHDLRNRVMLSPPPNVTVKMGSDSNLWVYWNQTKPICEDSEIRYRIDNRKWDDSKVSSGRNCYCINMPSSNSVYEMQVRRKFGRNCGVSEFWSDWSEPVTWGQNNNNNSTEPARLNSSSPAWTPVLYVLGTATLILLVVMLLYHERLRIILIPIVPKPSLISDDMDWTQLSKGLKESSKANYNERTCTVREYFHVSQSDSESSDSSTSSVTTDQTDCSISIPADKSGLSSPRSSSTSTVVVSAEETEQVSV